MINARAALKLTGLGALKNVARIDLADLLQLNNTAGTVEPNRIADGATITMRGGTVSAQSDQAHLITETLGAVALDRGLNTISGNQFMGLSLADLTRANRSVMSMGSISYTLQIAGAGPALSGSGTVFTPQVGIVPWARIDYFGIQPLTFDAGVLRPLSTSEVVGAIPSGTSTSNVKLTTDATLSSPATVNSLTLGLPSGNQTLAGTATLSVTSGAVFIATNQAATTTLATPLDFGSAEGIVHVNLGGGSTVNITGAISGSNGLTLAGTAALRGTSSYTGPTTVLGKLNLFDDVLPGQAGPLGTDTSSVVIDGSNAGITFYPIGGATIQFGRNIIASSFNSYGSVSLALGSFSGGAGTAVVSSDIQINGALNLLGSAKPGTGGYIFTGHLSGPGMLLNPNYVTLTGSSSFSGGVALNGGTIIVGDNNALGTGTLWFGNVDGSYLGAAAPTLTISNPIVVHRGMKTVGGFPITLSGRSICTAARGRSTCPTIPRSRSAAMCLTAGSTRSAACSA
jgi:hypothetical protein